MAIQLTASGQYFPVVLFIVLYKVLITYDLYLKSLGMTIQMKVTE